ncbi:MAG: hypothetical protein WDZ41_04455 [Candidatus Babeliales bacterium]
MDRAKVYILQSILLTGLSVLLAGESIINVENPAYAFSLDYLYPQQYFYRVESAAKELWSSLDVISTQTTLQADISFLYKQSDQLYRATLGLVAQEQEVRDYLYDDIAYLVDLIEQIEQKRLITIKEIPNEFIDCLKHVCSVMNNAKRILSTLLDHTKEIFC